MLLLIVVLLIAIYCLFISRSPAVGRLIHSFAMFIEKRLAKLSHHNIDIDGHQISYYRSPVVASRPTLLLLHGFSADKTIWHRFAKLAHKDFNLVIPDMLGHGDTPYKAEQSYSTIAQTQMLIKLMETLNIDKYHVVGNSMGGMIAMRLLLADSERVQRTVLLDPAGACTQFAKDMAAADSIPFALDSFEDFMVFYNSTMAKQPFVPPSVLRYVANKNYLARYDELLKMFSDFFNIEEFFQDNLDIDAARAHIIWGEKDALLPVSDAEHWRQITGSTVNIYANIGHMPMVECPGRTYSETCSFLLN